MPGFVIDEKKLRSALPPPVSSAAEDARVLCSIGAVALLIIGIVVLVVGAFMGVSRVLVIGIALVMALLWLLARRLLPDEPRAQRARS